MNKSRQLVVEKASPLAAAEVVACELVQGKDFGCVWHHHPECEITLVRSGGTDRWVGDKLTPLSKGDLVFLGSNLPHDYRNDQTRRPRRKPVDAIVIQFMPHLLGDDWLKRASMKPISQLFQNALLGLEIHGGLRRSMTRKILEISQTKGLRRVILLLEMLDEMAGSKEMTSIASPGFHQTTNAHSSDRIGWVVAFIEENLSQPIYVPTLAQKAGLSESAFSRLFKQNTGSTIPHYINELRISRACRLLAETDQTVGEIADTCGYPNRAHFQRQFQQLEGRSPLAYRSAVRSPS